jgi:hypothetical protein
MPRLGIHVRHLCRDLCRNQVVPTDIGRYAAVPLKHEGEAGNL